MSLKGTIRDSWDVWRRKVDTALGGSVEDIKASEVTFDGTTSSLSATNAQSAIDEVAGNIPEIPTSYEASAITYDNTTSGLVATDVQSTIDEVSAGLSDVESVTEKVHGGYVFMGYENFTVEGDGVKTCNQLLKDALDAYNTARALLEDDEYFADQLLTGTYTALPFSHTLYGNSDNRTVATFIGMGMISSDTKQILSYIRMNTDISGCLWSRSTLGNDAQTFSSDFGATVLANTTTITFKVAKYKKV